MYNKKYILEKIEEFNRHNHLYDDMEGRTCYLVYLNPGERGWFLYEANDWDNWPHRVHTTEIKSVVYSDGQVVVETQNTRFTFALEQNESPCNLT